MMSSAEVEESIENRRCFCMGTLLVKIWGCCSVCSISNREKWEYYCTPSSPKFLCPCSVIFLFYYKHKLKMLVSVLFLYFSGHFVNCFSRMEYGFQIDGASFSTFYKIDCITCTYLGRI